MAFLNKLCYRKQVHKLVPLLQKRWVSDDKFEQLLQSDSEYNEIADSYLQIGQAHNCLIIQPYIKWGKERLKYLPPEDQITEAKALISTLPYWKIHDTIPIPLENFSSKTLFHKGNLTKLTSYIEKTPLISAVFVNLSNLQPVQSKSLSEHFKKPILDRYKIVLQILKTHATSKHAKLQVALAEVNYLHVKLSKTDRIYSRIQPVFERRKSQLKEAMEDIRNQRYLLRNQRKKTGFPVVAVVGYTNAGKTSLIKALTGQDKLQGRNQLFATLDVTLHSGLLPSGMEVLYVDTVGFISHIPTNLFECFVATLEDAISADLILHVVDVSGKYWKHNTEVVQKVLSDISGPTDVQSIQDKSLLVGNKLDLVEELKEFPGDLAVSSTDETGINVLRQRIEDLLIKLTDRTRITVKVENGGNELRWIYKNATVVSTTPLASNPQQLKVQIIISKAKLEQFKHQFI